MTIPPIMWRVTFVSSEDGRGSPTHVGYTTSADVVTRFLKKYENDPYVTVQVFQIRNGEEAGYRKLKLD